jgi:hypothetical protein
VRDPATSDADGHDQEAPIKARAKAELAPPAQVNLPFGGGDGEHQAGFGLRSIGGPVRTERTRRPEIQAPCIPTKATPVRGGRRRLVRVQTRHPKLLMGGRSQLVRASSPDFSL